MKIKFHTGLIIFLIAAFAATTEGQTPHNANTSLSAEEQELMKARKANEEAQAEYYREQARRLREQPPATTPAAGKSFRQSVAENPASVVGVIGTILAALMVAIVGLTTLYVNNRNAIKSQRDTQFYEAMKRLGDQDSPTMRASAAGLLAQMAQDDWREFSLSKHLPPLKLARSKPYFTTSLDQLLTGLLVENNVIAINSIRDALQQLVPHAPRSITLRLYEANVRIQDELHSLIAERFVIQEYQPKRDQTDLFDHREQWNQLEDLTGYYTWILEDIVLGSESFPRKLEVYQRILRSQDTGDLGQLLIANQERLRVTSSRLRANVGLFATSLGIAREKGDPPPDFNHSFLIGGVLGSRPIDLNGVDLSYSELRYLSLERANMEKARLVGANLQATNLYGANLRETHLLGTNFRGADLRNVDMTGAQFGYTQIDGARLDYSNWWQAEFLTTNPQWEVDSTLLEKIFDYYENSLPSDLNEVSRSVRTFVENRRAKGETKQTS
jgi:hypothetical protein